VVGEDVDQFKGHRGEKYAEAMKIDFGKDSTPEEIRSQIENAAGNMRQYAGKAGVPKAKGKKGRKRKMAPAASEEEDFTLAPPVRDGLVLARASELPQPEKDQHFLQLLKPHLHLLHYFLLLFLHLNFLEEVMLGDYFLFHLTQEHHHH
jgi:hypothetical protein